MLHVKMYLLGIKCTKCLYRKRVIKCKYYALKYQQVYVVIERVVYMWNWYGLNINWFGLHISNIYLITVLWESAHHLFIFVEINFGSWQICDMLSFCSTNITNSKKILCAFYHKHQLLVRIRSRIITHSIFGLMKLLAK